ncbi:family 20 glycosylhydrolase [Streptomyces sp. TRM66268-LWL]|uniref:Family 20 glycosylhydrolase n=1 Tax=Streptomyces polyasparticus TaxID=2767826 RepID=A0ABR7SG08_9ACTN|nr:family 20 glycosylhydrolase [Streptomyces polyasparticus]
MPALREWHGTQGAYHYDPTRTRIVRSRAHAEALADTSRTFAADLRELTGSAPAEVTGTTDTLRPGDLYLTLGSADRALGREGYALRVGRSMTVAARTDPGVFYGTRTVLQLLRQGHTVSAGTARDWPLKPERGLMVDVGRKYFTPRWLAAHIKELAYLKLNYLHLYLTDNEGFRIESDSHPEVVSSEHLTKSEIRQLIALAARYKITVVPEIEAPGHMEAILDTHQELRLTDEDGNARRGAVDLTNPAAYRLVKDLYTEYLKLFPGPYFHIGADEYGANGERFPHLRAYARKRFGPRADAKDAYLAFINWANRLVRSHGKTARAWSDGAHGGGVVKVDPNVVLEVWYTHGLPPQQHVDNGHLITNASWKPTYYILGGNKPDSVFGYERWHPHLFEGGRTLAPAHHSRSLGAKLHVWCDIPGQQNEQQVAHGLYRPLRMLSQQVWGSPKPAATWADFQPVIDRAGRSPGWALTP